MRKTESTKRAQAGATRFETPRVLIEEWLPAAAIGVECMREVGIPSAKPPTTYLHVWWARRPLCVSRAAVLGSLLPPDFPRDVFERLLGFGRPGEEIVAVRRMLDSKTPGTRLKMGFDCDRAFKAKIDRRDLETMRAAAHQLWGDDATVLDPMAGGGSIPLEAARLGFRTIANEYNPVACSVLEATVDYPFRFGPDLARDTRQWAKTWEERFTKRVERFFPERPVEVIRDYIFAHTVPCPDTGFDTPLVPDWHLLKPSGHSGCTDKCLFAVPVVDRDKGTWTIRVQAGGHGAGTLAKAPPPSYSKGKGVSLFSGKMVNGIWQGQPIKADYIKAMAQQGKMRGVLYALVIKTAKGVKFAPPEPEDLKALAEAEEELARLRSRWETENVIPTERVPPGDKTGDPTDVTQSRGNDKPLKRGQTHWTAMFSPRQLLCMGVLVEELRNLRREIIETEGSERGEAIAHLLALSLNKLANWNANLASWNAPFARLRSVFDRHDYAWKPTFAEMASCKAGAGLNWAIENT